MSGSEDERIEQEIVVVGRQLAFVNHKLQGQLQSMKDLLHEQEISLGMEGNMDFLGLGSPSGCSAIDPLGAPLPARPVLIPPPLLEALLFRTRICHSYLRLFSPWLSMTCFPGERTLFSLALGKTPHMRTPGPHPLAIAYVFSMCLWLYWEGGKWTCRMGCGRTCIDNSCALTMHNS